MLNLYNTLTRQKEEFKPLHPPIVTYYSCGPTVYDFAHIGHARTFIFADVLQRALELNGFKVKRVMNITDVGHLTSDRDSGEDKMEKGAKREGKSVWDIAEFYTKDFMLMLDQLNIKVPEIICKATDNIKEMIDLIKVLEEKGFTYTIEDGIYFDTTKFPDYGKLTGQSFASLQQTLKAGARIEMVEGKKHPTDFALWKFSYPKGRSFDSAQDDAEKRRQMEWDSPFVPIQDRSEGKGFPGWHIECSAMSMKFLGQTIDIHTGGVDHIPIHHTNEIAQSEAASSKPFVRFWMHAEHLTVEGEKMSKSLHNFFRLQDINEKGFDSLALRYLFLTAHYHTSMNFTWQAMEGAQVAYRKLNAEVANLRKSISPEKSKSGDEFKEKFLQSINNDLNIPQAIALMWEILKSSLTQGEKHELVIYFDKIFGLGLSESKKSRDDIPVEIMELSAQREKFRLEKKWSESDETRANIEKQGYTVEDTDKGPVIRKK